MPLSDEEQQRLLTLHDQLDRNRQALAHDLRGTAKRLLTLSRALQDTTSAPPTASLAASLHHVQEQLRALAVTEAEISTLLVAAE